MEKPAPVKVIWSQAWNPTILFQGRNYAAKAAFLTWAWRISTDAV